MKRLFLASYFSAVAKRLPGFLDEDYSDKTVTFIPTACNVEKMDFFVASARKAFKKLGILVDDLDVSRASREEIEIKLRDKRIYLCFRRKHVLSPPGIEAVRR